MAHVSLITGGAKSGKSQAAERQLQQAGHTRVAYIATESSSVPQDAEMAQRIRRHQAQRPASWQTYECYQRLDQLILELDQAGFEACLIDCVTLWITHLLMDYLASQAADVETALAQLTGMQLDQLYHYMTQEVTDLLAALTETDLQVWIVTNEVGSGIVPLNKLSRIFRDLVGQTNQQLAQGADQVFFMVSGIEWQVK